MKNTINKVFTENPVTKSVNKGRSVKDTATAFFILGLISYFFMAFFQALQAYYGSFNLSALGLDTMQLVTSVVALFAFLTSFILNGVALGIDNEHKARNATKGLLNLGFIAISTMALVASIFAFYDSSAPVALLNLIGYSAAMGAWTLALITHLGASKISRDSAK